MGNASLFIEVFICQLRSWSFLAQFFSLTWYKYLDFLQNSQICIYDKSQYNSKMVTLVILREDQKFFAKKKYLGILFSSKFVKDKNCYMSMLHHIY